MTDLPPPPPPPPPPPAPGGPPGGAYPPPGPVPPAPFPAQYGVPMSSADRVRMAWQRRNETDYVFEFWTALGWTLLTCGIYGFYVFYQLMRRSRDHNLRRMELLDAASAFAWERANERGLGDELRPAFERIGMHMGTLRQLSTEFRDPGIWVLLAVLTGIAQLIGYIFIDGDLVRHDYSEGAVEAELSAIFERLGAPLPPPDPSRLKQKHNYVGRIIATIFTCGFYAYWWLYDLMTDGNRHFQHNWRWEDDLARGVQSLIGP